MMSMEVLLVKEKVAVNECGRCERSEGAVFVGAREVLLLLGPDSQFLLSTLQVAPQPVNGNLPGRSYSQNRGKIKGLSSRGYHD